MQSWALSVFFNFFNNINDFFAFFIKLITYFSTEINSWTIVALILIFSIYLAINF